MPIFGNNHGKRVPGNVWDYYTDVELSDLLAHHTMKGHSVARDIQDEINRRESSIKNGSN